MRWICQAVPARTVIVEYLKHHLPLDHVIMEDGHGPLATVERVWEAAGEGPCIVVEDDLVLARHAGDRMLEAVAAHPDAVVSFFTVTKADGWLPARQTLRGALALAYPAGVASALRGFWHTWEGRWLMPKAWDNMVGDWCKENGVQVWMEVPNLVEHLPLPSAVDPSRSKSRHSASFTDPEWDGFPLELTAERRTLEARWLRR